MKKVFLGVFVGMAVMSILGIEMLAIDHGLPQCPSIVKTQGVDLEYWKQKGRERGAALRVTWDKMSCEWLMRADIFQTMDHGMRWAQTDTQLADHRDSVNAYIEGANEELAKKGIKIGFTQYVITPGYKKGEVRSWEYQVEKPGFGTPVRRIH